MIKEYKAVYFIIMGGMIILVRWKENFCDWGYG